MDNNLIVDYSNWTPGKEYPEWMDEISLSTISKGYLLPNETVSQAYRRVANASDDRLKRPDLANKFFRYIWNGWIGLASPVISNMGTDRGLPISCYGIDDEAVQRMSWFDSLSAGKQNTDFFANRVTNYSKGVQNWDAADLF